MVFNYAKDELDIPIHLGHRVTEYFEDENQAGIVLDNGDRVGFILSFSQIAAKMTDWFLDYRRCCHRS